MEVCFVRGEREKRILKAAEYIVEHRATVRETAKIFGVSKSTIRQGRNGTRGAPGQRAGARGGGGAFAE